MLNNMLEFVMVTPTDIHKNLAEPVTEPFVVPQCSCCGHAFLNASAANVKQHFKSRTHLEVLFSFAFLFCSAAVSYASPFPTRSWRQLARFSSW